MAQPHLQRVSLESRLPVLLYRCSLLITIICNTALLQTPKPLREVALLTLPLALQVNYLLYTRFIHDMLTAS